MTLEDMIIKIGFKTDDKPLDSIGDKLDGIKHRLEFLAAAEVVKGIFELAEHFAGFAEHLQQSAYTAGLTAEALQKLTYAAGQSGVGAEDVTGAMSKLTRNLQAARDGSKEAQEAFSKAGFTDEQVRGFTNSSEAMAALADRIKETKDPLQKQATTMALLGRGTSNMVMFLSKGSKSLQEVGEYGERVGAIASNENILALAEFEDSMSTLGQVIKTIGVTIAGTFAPALKAAVDLVLEFWASNRKLFNAAGSKWIETLVYDFGFLHGVLEGLVQVVLDFAAAHPELTSRVVEAALAVSAFITAMMGFKLLKMVVSPGISLITSSIGGLWSLMTSVGGFVIRRMVPAFISLGGTIIRILVPAFADLCFVLMNTLVPAFTYLGSVIAATPIGWLIAGLTALVVVGHDLWAVFHDGKSFKDTWIGQTIEAIKGMGDKALKLFGFTGVELTTPETAKAMNDDFMAKQKAGEKAAANMGSMMAMNSPTAVRAAMAPAAAAAAPIDYSINAPITVNVPAGSDPKQTAAAVKDGVSDHLDRVLRNAQVGLRQAVAY